jgi:2-polyprenyl-6-methoxyphenol hydroxylase-like FAD-dependent oxidoreductase
MRVWGDDGSSKIEFDAYQTGVSELAWIVEDALLQDALWRLLQTQERLELIAPAEFEGFAANASGAEVTLRDGRRIRGQLAVGADGASSLLRECAGIEARERAYGHSAVVANFACERPHRNVALQWFQGGPVLRTASSSRRARVDGLVDHRCGGRAAARA